MLMDMGDQINRDGRFLGLAPPLPPPRPPVDADPRAGGSHWDGEYCDDGVSALNRCLTKNSKKLYVYDIGFKLKHPDVYDIGGTYTDEETSDKLPETWFFYSTTALPGGSYLLNLFVCHRKTGNFSIGVSNGNELSYYKKKDKKGQTSLPETLIWHMFRTAQPDENNFIKTYCFFENDVKAMELSTLVIPIDIQTNSVVSLKNDVIKRIKVNHDFGQILVKQERTDFVLISANQKQYPVHKMFLAAHSAVLRDLVKNKPLGDTHALLDLSDTDMELLLEFIYTGTIKNILKKDCVKLLQIADRFKLSNLFFLTQFALGEQINVENAVEVACIAENYNLEKLQTIVFSFIKNNPKVLETEGWKNLDDVNLAKKLFQFMHTKRD